MFFKKGTHKTSITVQEGFSSTSTKSKVEVYTAFDPQTLGEGFQQAAYFQTSISHLWCTMRRDE